ncbi:CLUMA_CG018921, isoform A [Clunio marinus]|uniref:trypsin n=1 Tax=Clunio marinus TaxID=568069 RepID=A0A1J1J150_9DIPT|nr:CLUMA_CG018921, isoform A [Clunio marinus]
MKHSLFKPSPQGSRLLIRKMSFTATGILFIFLLKNVESGFRFQIIHGYDTAIKNHPHQASYHSQNVFVCGASVLSEKYVLTAAHCTEQYRRDVTVRVGSSFYNKDGVVIAVAEIFQHPGFDLISYNNDFSVLLLEQELAFSDSIKPVYLPNDNEIIPTGTECKISGFGVKAENSMTASEQLQATDVIVVDHAKCAESYIASPLFFEITEQMICAADADPESSKDNRDSCSGDSGGAIICSGYQVGVISAGNGCGRENFPGIYASVAQGRGWIRDITGI